MSKHPFIVLFIIKKNSPIAPTKIEKFTLMRFMIIDTYIIIMNNHTCEIIDFINGDKINEALYFI